jgi:O-antigen/teichoic acid export membrane protein
MLIGSKLGAKFLRLTRNRTAKNGVWIISERIFSIGLNTAVTILAARYLGAANYGIISYGASFVTLFLGIMKLGLDAIIVNELIKNKDQQGEILGTSAVLRLVSGFISVVMILILTFMLNHNSSIIQAVAAAQAVMLIFQAFYIFDYWFQARLESKYVSIAKAMASVLIFIYSLYLLISGKSILWFAFSLSISSLVISIMLLYFYKKNEGQSLTFSKRMAKYLLGKSHHFVVASIIVSIYLQIDKILIINLLGNIQLGIYSAASTVCIAWGFLQEAIITSLRPTVFHAKLRSEHEYLRRLKQMYFILFWVSVLISAVISISAPLLVHVLFGDEYQDAAFVASVMVWFMPLSTLGSARNIWLVGADKGKYTKYFLVYGVIVNVILNLLWLPYIGIMGAALATIVTEIVTLFLAPLLYKATRSHSKIVVDAILYRL